MRLLPMLDETQKEHTCDPVHLPQSPPPPAIARLSTARSTALSLPRPPPRCSATHSRCPQSAALSSCLCSPQCSSAPAPVVVDHWPPASLPPPPLSSISLPC